jgi:hypothetical protein
VPERAWGFKSPLRHTFYQGERPTGPFPYGHEMLRANISSTGLSGGRRHPLTANRQLPKLAGVRGLPTGDWATWNLAGGRCLSPYGHRIGSSPAEIAGYYAETLTDPGRDRSVEMPTTDSSSRQSR